MVNLPAITNRIVNEYDPEKIVLFGSRAKGNFDEESDVDLFIIKKTNDSHIERAMKVDELFFPRDFGLDIIVRTPEEVEQSYKNNFFIQDIFKNGKILYSKYA